MTQEARVEAALAAFYGVPTTHETAVRCMTAALAAADAVEWQDISTAPKDGTKILLWSDGDQAAASWMTAIEDGSGEWIIYRQLGIGDQQALAVRFLRPTKWRHLSDPS